MLRPFGLVYIFLPDKRRLATHLYSMGTAGEIHHRTEIPDPELSELIDGADASLLLEVPARDRDPTLGDDGMPRMMANRSTTDRGRICRAYARGRFDDFHL